MSKEQEARPHVHLLPIDHPTKLHETIDESPKTLTVGFIAVEIALLILFLVAFAGPNTVTLFLASSLAELVSIFRTHGCIRIQTNIVVNGPARCHRCSRLFEKAVAVVWSIQIWYRLQLSRELAGPVARTLSSWPIFTISLI